MMGLNIDIVTMLVVGIFIGISTTFSYYRGARSAQNDMITWLQEIDTLRIVERPGNKTEMQFATHQKDETI